MLNGMEDRSKTKGDPNITFDVQVSETSNTKSISGYNAKEVILSVK